jgi:two-component system, OmpR family, KDP operon response regulator KdpE
MSGERVLIVDDEAPIRRALQIALTGHGYEVELAADGTDALVQIASRTPDAVILDLVLPRVDGLTALSDLRQWSDVPVIVLSARGQERDKVTALDLGADDYLTKPFGVDELLARLRAIMRRKVITLDSEIFTGDISINLNRRVVTKRGQEVHLTPTEYELLRALVRDIGKVLTHRHLLESVWGAYASENAQQLRVYVNYLRRKLENDPSHPQLIITEPGIGYRLLALDADPSFASPTIPVK